MLCLVKPIYKRLDWVIIPANVTQCRSKQQIKKNFQNYLVGFYQAQLDLNASLNSIASYIVVVQITRDQRQYSSLTERAAALVDYCSESSYVQREDAKNINYADSGEWILSLFSLAVIVKQIQSLDSNHALKSLLTNDYIVRRDNSKQKADRISWQFYSNLEQYYASLCTSFNYLVKVHQKQI